MSGRPGSAGAAACHDAAMKLWLALAVSLTTSFVLLLLQRRKAVAAAAHLPRAFAGWSQDGKLVLCIEAEVISQPTGQPARMQPSRWVVLDASAPAPLPIVWSAAASEAPETLKSALMARGFDPAILELRGQPPHQLEAGAGESVVLEGVGLRGRLDTRGRWASTPPRAFVDPHGARAFVAPDERVIALEPGLTLMTPSGFQRVPNAGVVTYRHDAIQGVLQLSRLRGASMGPTETARDVLRRVVAGYGLRMQRELGDGSCPFGTWSAALCEDTSAGMHMLAHVLSNGADLVFATFTSSSPLSSDDAEIIGNVVRSAR